MVSVRCCRIRWEAWAACLAAAAAPEAREDWSVVCLVRAESWAICLARAACLVGEAGFPDCLGTSLRSAHSLRLVFQGQVGQVARAVGPPGPGGVPVFRHRAGSTLTSSSIRCSSKTSRAWLFNQK